MSEPETLVPAQLSAVEEDTHRNDDQSMPDAHSPNDAGPGSDSDSDSDSEDEAQIKAQSEALETALNSNPSDYDSHVQYIKTLRKLFDLEKLKQARETMSSLFTLSPEMWQQWVREENLISRRLETRFSSIEKLYERAVSDYLSVPLWCDYLNFVTEHDPSVCECSASGISKARNLFERALTAAGLHVVDGHRIWELYREYEQALVFTIEETDSVAREKQTQRIHTLFHRQLSIPLTGLESTLLAYKEWVADNGSSNDDNNSEFDGLPSNVKSAYQKALEMLNARAHYEETISNEDFDSKKLQVFMIYLKFEHSSGDPARIQILYERAIADFPKYSDLWIEYTKYLYKTFKNARIVRDTYYRATRSCPWVGELWVHYLLSLERSHGSEKELLTVFKKSLQCTFSSFDEYLNIFLTRVDGLRRRLCASKSVEDEIGYSDIRDTFQRASDYLSPYFNNTDTLLHLYSYWARLELKLGENCLAAHGVWDSLLKNSGSMLEAWLAYIAWEIELGLIKEARSLYKKCYNKRFPGTGSEDICHSWLRFEREYGSMKQFDIAVSKVTPRLEELQLFKLQQESKNISLATNEKEITAKRRKNTSQNMKKTNEKDNIQAGHKAEAGEVAEIYVKKPESSIQEAKPKSLKTRARLDDQCTVFVSNLSLKATDEDLRNFFDGGGVVAVRILKDKLTRKSRGLAYVDFSDDAHLTAATEKNKQDLLGKRVSVLKSDPQKGRKGKGVERSIRSDHGNAVKQTNDSGGIDSQEAPKGKKEDQPTSSSGEGIQMKGRNTFAVPRNVKPLGRSTPKKPQPDGSNDETPKSNDEFRKMFIQK